MTEATTSLLTSSPDGGPVPPGSEWVSLHAFHTGPLDGLVLGAVAPVVEELRTEGLLHRWFFLRYWEGGMHLRLRLLAGPGAAGQVSARATEALREYLAAHPSPAGSGLPDYPALAAALAAQEHRSTYERVARPQDSVAAIRYEPETDVYGTGTALAAVEAHFTDSSRLALGVLRDAEPADRRRALALEVLLETLALLEPDLDRLAAGFASGADLAMSRYAAFPGADGLAAAYTADREQLAQQLERCWAQPPSATGMPGGWGLSLRTLMDGWVGAGANSALPHQLAMSPLAWHLFALPAGARSLGGVTLRCTHLLNNRIGVPLPDELLTGYLVARAMTDRVASGTRRGPRAVRR